MNKKKWTIKDLSLLVSIVLIATVTVGGSLAYLFTSSGPVVNEFIPSQVACEVTENAFNGQTKENVQIKNTGNTDAYIRAEVIVTWRDADGNILPQVPVERTDYEVTYLLNEGWSEGADGYYYYNKSVAPGESTRALIESCVQKTNNGYNLCVEIVAEAIQSKGEDSDSKTPVELAWKTALGQ